MRSTISRLGLLAVLALPAVGACSAKEDSPDDPAAGSAGVAGANPVAGAAGQASAAGVGSAGNAGASAGSSAGAAGTAGSASGAGGDSGASAGAAGAMAGAGGDSGASGTGAPAVTECDGVALPAGAIASAGPFEIGPEAAGLEPYFPTDAWRPMAPEMLGLDAAKLETAVNYDTQFANTQAVLVVRHGYVAAEKYFGSTTASTRHQSFSIAKSFSSALIGIAIEEGLVESVDEKLCMYYPQSWDCSDTNDPRSRITISHAMNIMTGLRWSEDWSSDATGPNDAINFDMLGTALGREAVEEPGTRMRYSTGDPALLSGVFEGATGMSALEYARQVLFGPIGIPGVQWGSDLQGRTTTYAGIQATAQEYAKLGLLYLNRGMWDGEQVVPAAWVDLTTRGDAPCEDWYRYLWHQNPPARLGTQDPSCSELFCPPTAYADLPPEIYFAEGINGQFIFIVPSADMVVVRLANDSPGSEHWDDYAREFLTLMLEALL
jgi:CubicO group peptidase (beta-lactamase class C family)